RNTATGGRSCRSCTAVHTTTACRAPTGTSSRRTSRRGRERRACSTDEAEGTLMMTALFIGMLTGITVWCLLVQRFKTKPWIEQGVIPASQDDFTSSAPKVGLWVFLGVVASLFLIFTGAYVMRMDHGHGGGMQPWVAVDEPR